MPEAYIYDHVRTPRGRGKADGALHEVTALALATAPLRALKERNNLGEDVVEAKAGSAVFVPRGTPHTYWNPGPGLVRYLLVMTSNVYTLIQEIHAMTDRSPAALSAVFQKHDSELLR